MSFDTLTQSMCMKDKSSKFELLEFNRKPLGERDVGIDV